MSFVSTPVVVPHLALPLVVGPGGSFGVLQQDSPGEIAQSVAVLLGTQLGDRVMVPSYGVEDPTFTDPDPNAITQAVARWEPRAAVTVSISIDSSGNASTSVQVAPATS